MNRKLERFSLVFLSAAILLAAMTACAAPPASGSQPGGETPPAAEDSSDPKSPDKTLPSKPLLDKESPDAQTPESDHPYDELLERYYSLVSDSYGFEDIAAGEFGVIEAARAMEDNALDAIGYTIEDISGDGVPELVVGTLPEYGGLVNAVYTLVDGQPLFVFEGFYRSGYSYMGNGYFFYYGSSSASETGQGVFFLTRDGTALNCEEFLFTHASDDDPSDIRVYYNTTGSWDPAESEEANLSLEDFWALDPAGGVLSLTPFSAQGTDGRPGETAAGAEPQVFVQLAPEGGDYDEVVLESGPYSCRLLFTTDSAVEYFTLLELTLEVVRDDGTMTFSSYPAVQDAFLETLSPEHPIVVELVFPGDLPNYGISYLDTHGDIRRFALEISGEDGSILLREAEPDVFGFVLRGQN